MHFQTAVFAVIFGLAVEEAAGAETNCKSGNAKVTSTTDDISTMLKSEEVFKIKTKPELPFVITGASYQGTSSEFRWLCNQDGAITRFGTQSYSVVELNFHPTDNSAQKCKVKLNLELNGKKAGSYSAMHGMKFDPNTAVCKAAVQTQTVGISSTSEFESALTKFYTEQMKTLVANAGICKE